MTNWIDRISGRFGRFGLLALLLVAAQTLFLIWMIADRDHAANSGDVITLKAEPVDPRDLLRGDYVILRYAISRVNFDGLPGDKNFAKGDTIYVSIAPAGSTWLAAGTYKRSNVLIAHGHKLIRGKVTSITRGVPRTRPIPGGNEMEEIACAKCAVADIAYGIEQYFVPEGKGKELEKIRDSHGLYMKIALAENGEATIAGVAMKVEFVTEPGQSQ